MKKIILLMLFFFLFTCQTNKSGKVEGLTNNQLVMLLYLTPNVEVRYTDITSPQTRVMMKANSIDPALLKNINGIPVSQYGDGDSDGYKDKFITPKAVSFIIRQIIAWKSVANGGPEPGKETVANGTRIDELGQTPGDLFYSYTILPNGKLARDESLSNTAALRSLNNLSKEHDRIGIEIANGMYYHFGSEIKDPNYRVMNVSLLKMTNPSTSITAFENFLNINVNLLAGDCSEHFTKLEQNEFDPIIHPIDEKNVKCEIGGVSAINSDTFAIYSNNFSKMPLYSPYIKYGNYDIKWGSWLSADIPKDNQLIYYKKVSSCDGKKYCENYTGDLTIPTDPNADKRYLFPIMKLPADYEEGKKVIFNVVPTNAFFYDTADPNSDTFDIAKEIPFKNGKDVKVHLPAFYISME